MKQLQTQRCGSASKCTRAEAIACLGLTPATFRLLKLPIAEDAAVLTAETAVIEYDREVINDAERIGLSARQSFSACDPARRTPRDVDYVALFKKRYGSVPLRALADACEAMSAVCQYPKPPRHPKHEIRQEINNLKSRLTKQLYRFGYAETVTCQRVWFPTGACARCSGSGKDNRDSLTCRKCGGTGVYQPNPGYADYVFFTFAVSGTIRSWYVPESAVDYHVRLRSTCQPIPTSERSPDGIHPFPKLMEQRKLVEWVVCDMEAAADNSAYSIP